MKKIFAISVLSLLAVVGADNAFALPYKEPFYTAVRIEQEIRQATAGMLTSKDIISPSETTTTPDYDAPSVSRMENTVNAAVATKVNNSQVVAKAGDAELATYATGVQAGTVTADSAQNTNIANVNAVAANFVPNVATTYRDDFYNIDETEMQPGLYTIMVEVDENGNKTFIWQAVQNERLQSSVGGQMPI